MKTKVLVLWIDNKLPLLESIYFFENITKAETGKTFKKVQLSITDKSRKNWKLSSRSFGNNQKGLDKLKVFLEDNKENNLEIDFALESLLQGHHYKSIDLDMHIGYNFGDLCSLNILFNEQENKNMNLDTLALKIADYLYKNDVNIKYGFGFVMENKKMPGFFCNGIYTVNLTHREKEIVSLIANKDIESLVKLPFYIQVLNTNYINVKKEEVNNIIQDNFKVFINNETILLVNNRNYEI